MSSFGVTPEGFKQKTLQELLAELQDDERAAFGPGINLLATSVFGQLNGIYANRLAELWEVATAIYRALYPDSASGDALDNVAAITGALRLGAEKSKAEVICTGNAGTTLLSGRVVSVVGAGDRFVSMTAATLAAATAWAPSTAYPVGALRTKSGNLYTATVAGISAPSGGPTGTGSAIVDGTVTWRFVGQGAAFALVAFESEDFGALNAPAFTLSTIETPVSGWQGAANRLDAELGRNVESDADFRVRREELLRVTGAATLEAIRSRVRATSGVKEAFVFENTTATVNANGLPPKSFEVVVDGGADVDVARTIFEAQPVGIETFGSTSLLVADSQGFDHTIAFSRPTVRQMYADLTVQVDPLKFPIDGVDQVKQAVVAQGDALGIGDDVIVLALRAAALDVAGVIDVTVCRVQDAFPPTNTANIPIALRELAEFDTSRVTVTTV